MNSNLFRAILAMDSYNRGYGAGIKFGNNPIFSEAIPNVTKIGNAVVSLVVRDDDAAAQSAGFYAIAYEMLNGAGVGTGEKVIAYRGTDEAWDAVTGWPVGGGLITTQLDMAADFYKSVLGKNALNITNNPYTANVSFTGHSLGGGLAGLVGANDNPMPRLSAQRMPSARTGNARTGNELTTNALRKAA